MTVNLEHAERLSARAQCQCRPTSSRRKRTTASMSTWCCPTGSDASSSRTRRPTRPPRAWTCDARAALAPHVRRAARAPAASGGRARPRPRARARSCAHAPHARAAGPTHRSPPPPRRPAPSGASSLAWTARAGQVHVGSLSDPDELPGLAHFLEHMLFLGTAKYPKEGEYHEFLSAHGGSHNAYTAQEVRAPRRCTAPARLACERARRTHVRSPAHARLAPPAAARLAQPRRGRPARAQDTVYFFDVVHDSLAGALDRFSQFFSAPLFTEAATARELSAVDSEHSNNLQVTLPQAERPEPRPARPHPAHPSAPYPTPRARSRGKGPAAFISPTRHPHASRNRRTARCPCLAHSQTSGATFNSARGSLSRRTPSASLAPARSQRCATRPPAQAVT